MDIFRRHGIRWYWKFAAVLLPTLLLGCTTRYVPPTSDDAAAVEFENDTNTEWLLYVYRDPSVCRNRETAGGLPSGEHRLLKFPGKSDIAFTVLQGMGTVLTPGLGLGIAVCNFTAVFHVEDGTQYRVVRLTPGACSLMVERKPAGAADWLPFPQAARKPAKVIFKSDPFCEAQ